MGLKIFLGSSGESKKQMQELAEWIEDEGHTPVPWTDHSVFPLGSTTWASLQQVAARVDAAIFVFGEDDKKWYRGDKIAAPRDNVLLEYGLFSGTLGDTAVAIAVAGKPKLATDLLGVTYLPLNRKAAAKNKLASWLTSIQSGAGLHAALARLRSPFQSEGKRSLFEQGTALIRAAKVRVALVARTPILIVGTRPYGRPDHAIGYEKEQFDEYINLARGASGGARPAFRCVASLPALAADIRSVKNTRFKGIVSANLETLTKATRRRGSKFRLRWCEDSRLMTFVVADDSFLIWFKDHSGENVWIHAENDVVARALWDQAEMSSSQIDTKVVASQVGL